MNTRIYAVSSENEMYLVEAPSKYAALRHVAQRLFNVEVAKSKEIVSAMTSGVKVEIAGEEPDLVELAKAA